MKYAIGFLLGLIVLSSCNRHANKKYLSPAVLEKQIFNINPRSDTTIITKAGVLIEIPSNSISGPGNGKVALEVMEALTLNDILQAGLTTNSGSQTLASGGMLSLSTSTAGAIIVKAIRARLPVPDLIEGMKTFKGKTDKDSVIQWTEQSKTSLVESDENDIAEGKALFLADCKACHEIEKDATGPMLSGVTSKRSMNWIIQYTRNYDDLLHQCDCEAIDVTNSRPAEMNVFPNLSDEQIKRIFRYVDKQAPVNTTATSFCFDTCKAFIARYKALVQKKDIIQHQSDTTKAVILNFLNNTGLPVSQRGSNFTPLPANNYYVSEHIHHSYYYQITIDAWGWYNMDILLKDYAILGDSKLMVNVPEMAADNVTVTLVVPSVKCITQGGPINGLSNQYGFMERDGSIRLPIGKVAYVLAYGDVDGQFKFAAQQFIVSEKQELTLTPVPSKPGELVTYLSNISNNEIKTKIAELETGKLLKEVNTALENLMKDQPRDCNCFCSNYNSAFGDSSIGFHNNCGQMPLAPSLK